MSKCCNCYVENDVKKFYSKFIGSLDCESQYYCDDCYNKVKADEEELIKFSISKGTNISTIIKNEYIIDYVNPTSTTIFFKPMNIYKVVSEMIDGVKKDFVMIEFEEYNNYMLHIACSNKKLIDDEELNRKQEKQLKQEETELKRINTINEREERFKRREEEYKQSIEKEIQINRFHNEKIKKIKEDLKVEYKSIFDNDKDTKIQKCTFCKNYKIYPIHYLDENNKPYKREYTKDKQKFKSICCMDCKQEAEQKKEDYKYNNTEHCLICDCTYIAFSDNMITLHLNSIKHKKNDNKRKGIINLSLLSLKELQKICSKTLNENGTYRIHNYTKTKKDELVKQMNVIYDLLTFD